MVPAHVQDVLGIGHSAGVSTILVPGAGEPNYDSHVADPFQGRKARREQEVHHLLEKLQPDMIVLDPSSIGQACILLLKCNVDDDDVVCMGHADAEPEAIQGAPHTAFMTALN